MNFELPQDSPKVALIKNILDRLDVHKATTEQTITTVIIGALALGEITEFEALDLFDYFAIHSYPI